MKKSTKKIIAFGVLAYFLAQSMRETGVYNQPETPTPTDIDTIKYPNGQRIFTRPKQVIQL